MCAIKIHRSVSLAKGMYNSVVRVLVDWDTGEFYIKVAKISRKNF